MSIGKNSINRASKATVKTDAEVKQEQKFYKVNEEEAKNVEAPQALQEPVKKVQTKPTATATKKTKVTNKQKSIQITDEMPNYLL